MSEHPIYIIVAVEKNDGIGIKGKLPWHFKKEIKYFKDITIDTKEIDKINMLVMGRKTWESIPEKYRPLEGRKNIVLTSQEDYETQGATTARSLSDALEHADEEIEKIFIIGGARVFEDTMKDPRLTGLYLTKINKEYTCDTSFPKIPEKFSEVQETGHDQEDGVEFQYYLIQKPSNQSNQQPQ